jgi:GTP-binding protein Era
MDPDKSTLSAIPFHAGFVAVVGRPNAGKSTLLNTAIRQRIASVSAWPQTTRRRQLGILTMPNAQLVLVDTPGLHHPKNGLGRAMMRIAEEVVSEADAILYIADIGKPLGPEERELANWIRSLNRKVPILLALNKQDMVAQNERPSKIKAFQEILPDAEICMLSAEKGEGVPELLDRLAQALPENPAFYPDEDITDLTERQIVEDMVHEAALNHLRDEVGHGVAVRVDEFIERNEESAHIDATLFVERESHKPIVIGKGGAMLRAIGTDARRRIEEMSGRKVYLALRVKVLPHWREQDAALRRLGFTPSER